MKWKPQYSGHAAHCSVPILKYCGITSQYTTWSWKDAALICCSSVSFTVEHEKSKMEVSDGETESGSVAPVTTEKISRGLHPTSTTTAREQTEGRGLTLTLFLE